MKVVYKYELLGPNPGGTQLLPLPQDAQILRVDMQNHIAVMWALVDPGRDLEDRTFMILGTGHESYNLDEGYIYHGTFYEDVFVWHLFELRP